MSRQWIFTPAYGWGKPNMPLSSAVYASAAFPAAFPPLRVGVKSLKMSGGDVGEERPKRLLLADGGVYNNLGTDWFPDAVEASSHVFGLESRFDIPPDVDQRIIVQCLVAATNREAAVAMASTKLSSFPADHLDSLRKHAWASHIGLGR
jgi:predicted acylesterase/phospholipase RssA